jgi:hypothetical protein
MSQDKLTLAILEALRRALAESGEQPIFKAGNRPGLFSGKSGIQSEAADRAKRDGLLEIIRTETKGKATLEWARITPAGVNFLHDHESPQRALSDLRELLQSNLQSLPNWLGEMRDTLQQLSTQLSQDAERWTQQLEGLSRRVEEALERTGSPETGLNNGITAVVPWAADALAYLDRRRMAPPAGPCTLRELFAALKVPHPALSLTAFHNGLRRLQDARTLRLLPGTATTEPLPEPEYALLDGGTVLYFVSR